MVHVSSQRTRKPLLLKREWSCVLGLCRRRFGQNRGIHGGGVCVRGHRASHLGHLVSARALLRQAALWTGASSASRRRWKLCLRKGSSVDDSDPARPCWATLGSSSFPALSHSYLWSKSPRWGLSPIYNGGELWLREILQHVFWHAPS